jgi:hypothetical protein
VAGCLVYIIAGACLTVLAIPLDQALLPQSSASTLGPFTAVASTLGLLAGIAAFLYVRYPEGGVAKFIRERLHGGGNPENPGSR